MNVGPHIMFGGGATETFMSPIVLAAMVITIALVCLLPRKWIIAPFLGFAFLTPLGEEFDVGGMHFFALRIVILVGCVSLFTFKRPSNDSALAGGFNTIDKLFFLLAIVQGAGLILIYRQGGAVVSTVGMLWDVLGGYFLVRCLIRDEEDIRRTAKVLVVIAIVMAVCMTYEKLRLENPFALLMGGKVVPDVRDGHVRCRGIFEQEILASSFGGTLAPLFMWLWKDGKTKVAAFVGVAAALVIIFTSSSSTGVSAFGFGVIALCLWPIRRHMRLFRWGIVAVVLGLALSMKAPIWYLMARVDFAGGSTGWDRAHLVDVFVRHFWGWWLYGAPQRVYMRWMDVDYGWDLCNQYVATCAVGGLAALALLIAIISKCFGKIGKARKLAEGNPKRERLLWVLGALMAAHMAAFVGISYFDQSRVWWYVTLAMISAAAIPVFTRAQFETVAEDTGLELESVSSQLV